MGGGGGETFHAPLSRAIQKLERRLGVVLLDRDSRTVALTNAGSVLLREARAALESIEAAERRTRRAASTRPELVLATKAGASNEVVVLPASHPAASQPQLSLDEITALSDLPLPRWPEPDGTYLAGLGPEVRNYSQLSQLIALGRACALVPESVSTGLPATCATVPVPDAPPVTTVIAWPPHSRSRPVAALVRIAMCE
ncbi:hypothetical protein GCM10011591_40950 [Nocardia camponoti]|uniref:HTH lysR-type domain-containing protein n=1 Tax=Nocardia camponoti TaxID=1616106 RepID=A0A917QRS8_9NOCA|nr:hypothetical protein GCM10011591_40950 [Nocardia camponoti]